MNRPSACHPIRRAWAASLPLLLAVLLLAGCATPPHEEARQLARQGRGIEALALIDRSLRESPANAPLLRTERTQLAQTLVLQTLAQAERARTAGRVAETRALVQQARALVPDHPRVAELERELQRGERADAEVAAVREALAGAARQAAPLGEPAAEALRDATRRSARERLAAVLREQPQHAAARALMGQLMAAAAAADAAPAPISGALARTVSLEFREAPLRQVFEALARTHGLNFVFDKDVRADHRVTLALRDMPLAEALRVLLVTQQLERKWLNERTLLVYPATAAKQREHAELVTRTLYLTNGDAKTLAAMVRTMAKTQDVHVDERINAIVVRDTPAVVRLVEDLVAGLDLPEAEVLIDVEVLEVSSSRLTEIGLQWPQELAVGEFNQFGQARDTLRITRGMEPLLQLRAANPLLLASLRANDGDTQTLANPTIRTRNREKAQVHVGEKLPVFTTTSAANVGVSASVSYLDVGIKLDVEPTVQLDDEVTIRVTLEVSNLVRQVGGPAGSVGYELGTRRTSTTLRLADGETQVLAGLTKHDELRNVNGVPGLARLPWLGRLFGVDTDQRRKTEVVLLMTPRIVRNLPLPEAALSLRPGGTALNPGAEHLRVSGGGQATLAAGRGALQPATASPGRRVAGDASPATAAEAPRLVVEASDSATPGQTATVTLRNPGSHRISGELQFDPALLANAAAGAAEGQRAWPFDLPAGASVAWVLRVLPAAAGVGAELSFVGLSAVDAAGLPAATAPTVEGRMRIEVRDAPR
ncbi:MAG: general secretion pathway protein GspD [Rubrivivax sp.]|nr:general secretion pathway protein GspD [Rubrivivax sp.]